MNDLFLRLGLILLIAFGGGMVSSGAVGCKTPNTTNDEKPQLENPKALDETTALFYKYMRWEMFDEASQLVSEELHDDFLAEFADDDDIDITNITLIDAEPKSDHEVVLTTRVEWFRKAQQVMKKEKFTEVWTWDGTRWTLKDRVETKRYLAEQKEDDARDARIRAAASSAKSADDADADAGAGEANSPAETSNPTNADGDAE